MADTSLSGKYRMVPSDNLGSGNIGIRTKLAARLENHNNMRENRVKCEARVKRKVAVIGRSFGFEASDRTAFWMMKLAFSWLAKYMSVNKELNKETYLIQKSGVQSIFDADRVRSSEVVFCNHLKWIVGSGRRC